MARAKGPGKSYRTGLSLMEAFDRFPMTRRPSDGSPRLAGATSPPARTAVA